LAEPQHVGSPPKEPRVLVVDRDRDGIDQTVAQIESDGGVARGFVADVTDASSVRAYVEAAKSLGDGHVNAFFNNAGIEGATAPIDAYPDDTFDQVLAVNVRGVFLGLKYVAPAMPDGGAIVNAASSAGVTGFPGGAGYVASKHAVIGLTRTAALDLAPRGIRVNALCPGPVEGRMMKSLEDGIGVPDGRAVMLSAVPLGRYAEPEEIAATATFLLSDEARFATGATFSIDGGQTLN
jgi:NAD(P)-dependent dehydrogenase (short-subunit alcohol dehydrogenase family)